MRRSLPAVTGLTVVASALFGVVTLTLNTSVWAQNAPMQASPLPPLQQQQGSAGGLRPPSVAIPGTNAASAASANPPAGNSIGQNYPGPNSPGAPSSLNSLGGSTQGPNVQGPSIQSPSAPGGRVQALGAPAPIAQGFVGIGPNVQRPAAYGPTVLGQGPAQGAAQAVPMPRTNLWMPAGTAKLQALDKVNAQATELTIRVGQSMNFGSLTIAVKGCMVRPPDQPPDAAAFLDIKDSRPDSPGFAGWMLQDAPSVSMMQHPIYDLRVTGCT